MKSSKNIFLILFAVLSTTWCAAQCNVPSMPKNVFVLVASHKIKTDIKNDNIKHLSGGVTFQINDYQLKADSAVVFNDARSFEAFGNVVLTKNDTNYQNAKTAYYREDAHIITFNDKIVYDVGDRSLSAKSTAVLY